MKRNLNSDGQQFHQDQQNEQSPPHLKSLNIKKKNTTTYDARNQGLGFGRGKVEPVNGVQTFILNIESQLAIQIDIKKH